VVEVEKNVKLHAISVLQGLSVPFADFLLPWKTISARFPDPRQGAFEPGLLLDRILSLFFWR